MKKNNDFYLEPLRILFPNAGCELNYNTAFELVIAVVLSAQTTDQRVNTVTPILFEKFKDCYELANADYQVVKDIVSPLGLASNKAKSIIELSKQLVNDYNGVIPSDFNEMIKLSGVGRKTASVISVEVFKIPAVPVDTHVHRVSKRLKIANKNDSVEVVEKKIKKKFDQEDWIELHHLLIFFGRYLCLAKNPKCEICPFTEICQKSKVG